MSVNRENVVWKQPDGTWAIAFYAFDYVNEDSDDFDYEWDVEYHNYFDWASTGHSTIDGALDAWDGPNPGGHVVSEGLSPRLDERLEEFRTRSKEAK